jgi:hypothetical protein
VLEVAELAMKDCDAVFSLLEESVEARAVKKLGKY